MCVWVCMSVWVYCIYRYYIFQYYTQFNFKKTSILIYQSTPWSFQAHWIILGFPGLSFVGWSPGKEKLQAVFHPKKNVEKKCEHCYFRIFWAQRFLFSNHIIYLLHGVFLKIATAFKSSSVKRSAMLPGTSKPGMSMSFTLVCLKQPQWHGVRGAQDIQNSSRSAEKKNSKSLTGRFSTVFWCFLHRHHHHRNHLRRHI